MKLIEPSFTIIEQEEGLDNVYKHIELCGRTCYKSTDKITESSAKPFVDKMIKAKHYAMIEHGTIYLKISYTDIKFVSLCMFYSHNRFSEVTHSKDSQTYYITTNLRVIMENHHEDDLQYICTPTEHHKKRVTVKFICDNGVAREFCRHRVFSFAQESTRYCNYSKSKFNSELTFIEPCWYGGNNYGSQVLTNDFLRMAEHAYLELLDKYQWKPEQARTVLPLALKTELVMTGFIDDWQHFFDLRALDKTGKAHPQAKELALPLFNEFKKRGYINNN